MSAPGAVARNLVRETLRGPAFPFYLVGLLLVAYLAPRLAGGGDLLRQLRLTVTYGLGLPVILIALTTLAISGGSLAHEIERRRVHLLVTKPVPRWQILLGKLAGVLLLDLLLVLLVLGVFLTQIWSISAGGSSKDRRTAVDRFFTARLASHPLAPEVDEQRLDAFLKQRHAELEQAGRKTDLRALEAEVRRLLQTRRVDSQEEVVLRFRGVRPLRAPGERLLVRFQFNVSSPEAPLHIDTVWKAKGPRGLVRVAVRAVRGTPSVVGFPAEVVHDDGTLTLVLRNDLPPEPAVRVLLDPEDVEVLYACGGLWSNVARAMLIVLGQLAFLAAVGIFGAALFSLPTAALLSSAVYLACMASGFLSESLVEMIEFGGAEARGGLVQLVAEVGQTVLGALPDFSRISESGIARSAMDHLADGRSIALTDLGRQLAETLVLRTGVVVLVATVLWHRRELGEAATP